MNNIPTNTLSNVHPDRVQNIALPKVSAVEKKTTTVTENKINQVNTVSKENRVDKNTIAIYSSPEDSGFWIMKFFVESGITNNDIDISNIRIYKPKKGNDILLQNEQDTQKILSNK